MVHSLTRTLSGFRNQTLKTPRWLGAVTFNTGTCSLEEKPKSQTPESQNRSKIIKDAFLDRKGNSETYNPLYMTKLDQALRDELQHLQEQGWPWVAMQGAMHYKQQSEKWPVGDNKRKNALQSLHHLKKLLKRPLSSACLINLVKQIRKQYSNMDDRRFLFSLVHNNPGCDNAARESLLKNLGNRYCRQEDEVL